MPFKPKDPKTGDDSQKKVTEPTEKTKKQKDEYNTEE